MTYNPKAKVYYGKHNSGVNNSDRLTPAPQISITPEFYYANDTIVGYTYSFTIQGYAASIDLVENKIGTKFNDVLDSIKKIRSILNLNGGTLLITDSNDKPLLKAIGGTLKNLSFDESENRWVNYAPYTAEIEFNEVEFGSCDGIIVDPACTNIPEGVQPSPELINMQKYRVKSFTDTWSFNLEDQIYNGYGDFRNEHFNISYTINANGKHYFKEDKLLPAWEQAKNFVQDRLKTQVDKLINNILRRNDNGCAPDSTLANVFRAGPPGILEQISGSDYSIYNETVSCTTSESDGTFSATYNAILKRKTSSGSFFEHKCLHTYSVSRDIQDDGTKKSISMSVDGNIQGLIEGGVIRSAHVLSLPQNGKLFLTNNPTTTKYDNALSAYNKIGSKSALNSNFQSYLGITNASIGVTGDCIDPSGSPRPANHSVSHNYTEGVITYKSDYNTETACAQSGSYRNISVSIEDSIPLIAEFVIPGRIDGPIIQKIGPKSPKKITINIEGSQTPDCCATSDQKDIVDDICKNGLALPSGVPVLPGNSTDRKLVQDQMTSNPVDGSYSITKTYICCEA
jgi:hypothetical protein